MSCTVMIQCATCISAIHVYNLGSDTSKSFTITTISHSIIIPKSTTHGPGLSNHRGWETLEVEVEGNIDRTLAQSLCIKLPH